MDDATQEALLLQFLGPIRAQLQDNAESDDPVVIVVGTVKRYDRNKGYGFLEVPGHTDHFLFYKPLKECGIEVLPEDSVVMGVVDTSNPRGPTISEIIAVTYPVPEQWTLDVPYENPTDWVRAKVKIPIMTNKGFGFLHNPEGGQDIFLLHGVVDNASIVELAADQVIEVRYASRTDEGYEGRPIAVEIRQISI